MPEAKEPSQTARGHASEPIEGKCNGDKGGGALCRNAAGKGTSHLGFGRCKNHGGSTPTHVKAAEKAMAAAAVVTYGLPRDVDPRVAILEEVHRTAGAVAYLESKVRELSEDDLVWGRTVEDVQGATEFRGTNVKSEAKPNIWRQMFLEERKHLVAVSKTAVDVGIEERQIRLAEQMGSQMAAYLRFVLDGLNLAPEQQLLVGPRMVAGAAQLGLTNAVAA